MRESSNFVVKVLIAGDSGSGKSSIISRYTKDTYTGKYSETKGMDLHSKNEINGNNQINLNIWDLSGSKKYEKASNFYLKGSNAGILVFSFDNPDSFNSIEHWVKKIEENCSHIPLVIVGNKNDLVKKVDTEKIEGLINKWKKHWREPFLFTEVSAKENANVDNPFSFLIDSAIKKINEDDAYSIGYKK